MPILGAEMAERALDKEIMSKSKCWNDSYGNQVLLDNGEGLSTRYAHITQTAVTAGEAVTAGQVIGYVGNTGDSTGNHTDNHLHFEVLQGGVRVDPLSLVS